MCKICSFLSVFASTAASFLLFCVLRHKVKKYTAKKQVMREDILLNSLNKRRMGTHLNGVTLYKNDKGSQRAAFRFRYQWYVTT